MKPTITPTLAILLALLSPLSQAQVTGDATTDAATAQRQHAEMAAGTPARWTEGDATDADRMRILRKEIGAALNEALTACRKGEAAARPACIADARKTYRQDMANAPQILRDNNKASTQ